MKERPILFNGAMVRAVRAGEKTQTRRVVKPVGDDDGFVLQDYGDGWWPYRSDDGESAVRSCGNETPHSCPYGKPGDRLSVRETFWAFGRWVTRYSAKKGRDEWHFIDMTLESGRHYRYATETGDNGPRERESITPQWWKRPAIFMPRAASRILLEIVSVRVERLNDCSEADAQAEGCSLECMTPTGDDSGSAIHGPGGYIALWESINGPDSWHANPWVWVIEFRRVQA